MAQILLFEIFLLKSTASGSAASRSAYNSSSSRNSSSSSSSISSSSSGSSSSPPTFSCRACGSLFTISGQGISFLVVSMLFPPIAFVSLSEPMRAAVSS